MKLEPHLLRNLRYDLQLSQEAMAEAMSIQQSTYNRLETGKIKLKVEHITKIAKAIGKSEDEVFNKLRVFIREESSSNLDFSLAEKERLIEIQSNIIKLQHSEIQRLQNELVSTKKQVF